MKYSVMAQVDDDLRVRAIIKSRMSKIEYQINVEKRDHIKNIAKNQIKELQQKVDRLDKHYIIRTSQILREYGTTEKHMMKIFGWYSKRSKKEEKSDCPYKKFIDNYMKQLTKSSKKMRVSSIRYRIETAMIIANHFGYYMVFNGLSVRDDQLKEVFKPRSKYWNTYLKNWDRYTIDHDFMAVVERGGKNGRLHIHVIHIFKDMKPWFLKDPNLGKPIPTNRELTLVKKFWKAGFSTPIAVRMSANDAWARIGFRWPIDKETSQPIEVKPPIALARYITKYVTKAYLTKEKTSWRTRMSRKLGLQVIKSILRNTSTDLIENAFMYPVDMSLFQLNKNPMIPKTLMCREAHREISKRMNQTDKTRKLNIFQTLNPQQSIKQQLQTLIPKKGTTSNLQNIIHTPMKKLTNTDISDLQFIVTNVEDHWLGNKYVVVPKGVTKR